MASILNGGSGRLLQIVPRVKGINGGRGRATSIVGTGFTEGFIAVRFGQAQVVDQGPNFNDGVDVFGNGGENRQLNLTVPPDGTLPYEVITEGGRSGRSGDVTAIPATAETGTPANASEASANVDQSVTMLGEGFVDSTRVVLEGIDGNGMPFIATIAPTSVAADGKSLVFIVPSEARTGMVSILNGGAGRLLQIVPRVKSISGGRGRPTSIIGTGFTEGFITVRFGPAQVVDQGPNFNDGVDVIGNGGENRQLNLTVPSDGALPYEVTTEGGRSGRDGDVTAIVANSATGTPANPSESSANIDQSVTMQGEGFVDNTRVLLEGIDGNGTQFITTVSPTSVAPDGKSLVFVVPAEARTGMASILNGGGARLLQIIPQVKIIGGGRGRLTALIGSGFTEGFITVRFGSVQVIDQGPNFNDGVDVFGNGGENRQLNVMVPPDGILPYEVITEGGRSGRPGDVSAIPATASTGTPAKGSESSVNVDQSVTLQGEGFSESVTKVLLEGIDGNGTPFIITVSPASFAADGRSLVFIVPSEARTGFASILNGGNARLLQIVPVLNSVSSVTPGQNAFLQGTGFTEGEITVQFGSAKVIDGGVNFNDGIDVFGAGGENRALNVTVPANGSGPVTVVTGGGTSNGRSP
jgi:hypothetical protein